MAVAGVLPGFMAIATVACAAWIVRRESVRAQERLVRVRADREEPRRSMRR